MKKKSKDPSDPAIQMVDKLLGPVEDLSQDELLSTIADAGIDLAAARRTLYEKVSDLRSTLWAKNADVSSDITSLLSQLRPHDLPSSDPKVAAKAAGSWIRDLVDRHVPGGTVEFAVAARNLDGSLSAADQEVMRELEQELKSQQDRDKPE